MGQDKINCSQAIGQYRKTPLLPMRIVELPVHCHDPLHESRAEELLRHLLRQMPSQGLAKAGDKEALSKRNACLLIDCVWENDISFYVVFVLFVHTQRSCSAA